MSQISLAVFPLKLYRPSYFRIYNILAFARGSALMFFVYRIKV